MTSLTLLAAVVLSAGFEPVEISFYTMGRVTADGTPMRLDGEWVATRRFPLGSEVELRYGGRTMTLRVRDRTARHTGHRADLPKGTWLRFGRPASRGILRGEWRMTKCPACAKTP